MYNFIFQKCFCFIPLISWQGIGAVFTGIPYGSKEVKESQNLFSYFHSDVEKPGAVMAALNQMYS